MKSVLKASLTTLLMTSVSIGMIATVTTFASADVSYAKSENAGNKSDNGRGNSGKEHGKSASKGKSGEKKAASRGKSSGGLDTFFNKLTGRDKRSAKSSAPAKVEQSPGQVKAMKGKRAAEGNFHPSELGNMNGALNANINAVLAHIRNGNTNGPVGHVAALVAARASTEGDRTTADRAALFVALEEAGYDTVDDYYLALDGVDPVARDEKLDSAIMALGYSVEDREDVPEEVALDPTDPLAEQALGDLDAVKLAEQNILAYWNKNPGGEVDAETGLTADEALLLEDLRARFSDEDLAAIKDAVDETAIEPVEEGEVCAETDAVCDDDDLASL